MRLLIFACFNIFYLRIVTFVVTPEASFHPHHVVTKHKNISRYINRVTFNFKKAPIASGYLTHCFLQYQLCKTPHNQLTKEYTKSIPIVAAASRSAKDSADVKEEILKRLRRQAEDTTKKEESFEVELCKDKDAGEWFRLVAGDGDNCRDVIQCTSSVRVHFLHFPTQRDTNRCFLFCLGPASNPLPRRSVLRHREADLRLEGRSQKLQAQEQGEEGQASALHRRAPLPGRFPGLRRWRLH